MNVVMVREVDDSTVITTVEDMGDSVQWRIVGNCKKCPGDRMLSRDLKDLLDVVPADDSGAPSLDDLARDAFYGECLEMS